MARSEDDPRYLFLRRIPRERFVEIGRAGGRAKAARRVPSLQAVVDLTARRQTIAAHYASAIVELHRARDAAVDAFWSREATAMRRTWKWVAAANANADRCYAALVEIG